MTEANDDDPENYDKLVEIRDKNPDIQVKYRNIRNRKLDHKICHLYRFYWPLEVGHLAQLHSKSSHRMSSE